MLNTGDKIILTNEMGMFTNVGEVCEVMQVEDNGNIWFTFGNGMHLGCMSPDEFEKYFEVYEEPGRMTMDDAMELIEESEVIVETVFDRCTVVCCKLPNDFVIVESSAALDINTYSEEIGYDICLDKIANKILELNAYKVLDDNCDDDYDCDADEWYDENDDYDYNYDCSGCGNCLHDDWTEKTKKHEAYPNYMTNDEPYSLCDIVNNKLSTDDIMTRMGWRF